jgi:hypothetical protein
MINFFDENKPITESIINGTKLVGYERVLFQFFVRKVGVIIASLTVTYVWSHLFPPEFFYSGLFLISIVLEWKNMGHIMLDYFFWFFLPSRLWKHWWTPEPCDTQCAKKPTKISRDGASAGACESAELVISHTGDTTDETIPFHWVLSILSKYYAIITLLLIFSTDMHIEFLKLAKRHDIRHFNEHQESFLEWKFSNFDFLVRLIYFGASYIFKSIVLLEMSSVVVSLLRHPVFFLFLICTQNYVTIILPYDLVTSLDIFSVGTHTKLQLIFKISIIAIIGITFLFKLKNFEMHIQESISLTFLLGILLFLFSLSQ